MKTSSSHRPVVLAVEDEPLILMLAVDMIAEAGFEPVLGYERRPSDRHPGNRDDIGVIFTDINMPGSMDGLKLARAVRRRWPPIRIIVTSALAVGDESLLPMGSKFISKPYDSAEISNAIRRLSDNPKIGGGSRGNCR